MSVSFGSHAKPRKPRAKTSTIVTFTARLVADGAHYLELHRGANVVELDKDGNRACEYHDGRKLCFANVGDKLMLLGDADDAIALAEITAVDRDGMRYRIRRVDGLAPVKTGEVRFMRVKL